jgi:hypothetical protein
MSEWTYMSNQSGPETAKRRDHPTLFQQKMTTRRPAKHLAALLALGAALASGCGRSASTTAKIKETFETASGMEKVQIEATSMFEHFGTNEFRFLYEPDLKDFPMIAALGNSVGIYPATPGLPANIRIRFGSHRNTKFIFIYDPKDPSISTNSKLANGLTQVTTNIFIQR